MIKVNKPLIIATYKCTANGKVETRKIRQTNISKLLTSLARCYRHDCYRPDYKYVIDRFVDNY